MELSSACGLLGDAVRKNWTPPRSSVTSLPASAASARHQRDAGWVQRFEPHYSSNTRTEAAVTPKQNASTMMRNDPSQGPLSRPPHQRRSVCAVPDWIGRTPGARALEGKRGAAVRVWSLTDRPHHAIG